MPSRVHRGVLIIHARLRRRAEMIAVKSVVREQNDRRLWTSEFQNPPEHQIVKLIHTVHHMPIGREVLLRNMPHPRRVILHEVVAHHVDGVVEHHRQVNVRLRFQQPGRDVVDRGASRHLLGEHLYPAIARVQPRQLWHQRENRLRRDLTWMHTSRSKIGGEIRRMDALGRHRPRRIRRLRRVLLEQVRHVHAADRLGRMRRVPVHHQRPPPALGRDVPECFGRACRR